MNNQLEFFNLFKDGDSAIIRILNTTVDKIETKTVHKISVNGKNKIVPCLGNGNCPLCESISDMEGVGEANTRLYVHLWDYTDNKEKVWNRTPNENFLNALRDVEANWGNLTDCVLKITRKGDNFPKYDLLIVNPSKYPMPDNVEVDANVAFRFSSYRSAEELEEYVKTGFLPDHVKKNNNTWLPKEEWIKQQKEKENAAKSETKNVVNNNVNNNKSTETPIEVSANNFDDDFDGPMFDPFSKTRI